MKVKSNLDKFYYYAFPMPTVLVTCNDEQENTNIITVAWHTTISKKPPLYGVSIAPSRYSHGLIKNSEEFVVNFAPYNLLEKVHFCGKHTGRKTNKAKETNLTKIPSQKVKTPCIKECYAHLECKLVNNLSIGDHTLFIGNVLNVQADKNAFETDMLQTSKIQPIYYIGGNSYTTIDKEEKKTF